MHDVQMDNAKGSHDSHEECSQFQANVSSPYQRCLISVPDRESNTLTSTSAKQYVSQFKKWGIRKYGEGHLWKRYDPTSVILTCGMGGGTKAPHPIDNEAIPSKRSLPSSFSTRSSCPRGKSSKITNPQPVSLETTSTPPAKEEVPSAMKATDGAVEPESSAKTQEPPCDDFEEWTREQGPFSIRAVRHTLEVTNDASRPLDTFTKSDIRNLKSAADFLYATNEAAAAFSLYAVILKILKSSHICPQWMLTWTIIACSVTASRDPQIEIARALLENSLNELQEDDPLAAAYLLNRLLKSTYDCAEQDRANRIIRPAPASRADRSIMLTLPMEHRALDLWTYAFFQREWGFHDCSFIRHCLINRTPGPFEVQNGVMNNSCLRSCIQWCSAVLKERQRDDHLQYGGTSLSAICGCELGARSATSVIFVWVWSEWHARRSFSGSGDPLWILKAEKLMGISACDLLRTVIAMSVNMALARFDTEYHQSAFWGAYQGLAVLAGLGDELVASEFLDTFVDVHFEPVRVITLARLRVDPPMKDTRPSWFRTLAGIGSPWESPSEDEELKDFQQYERRNSNRGSETMMILPPLAPSSRSSERSLSLLQMKALRDKFAAKARDRGAEPTMPSSVCRGGSERGLAISSVSALSESFGSSLSISSPRHTARTIGSIA